jgi:hypothetical protein
VKALHLANMPNDRRIYQLSDGTILEISPNPATKEPSPWHKLLDTKMDVYIDLPDGTGLTGARTKSINTNLFGLLIAATLGAAVCYGLLLII